MTSERKLFVDESACCPRCGSDVIDEHPPEYFPGELTQGCECRECGYKWTDVYRYSHSEAERLPETDEEEVKRRIVEMSQWPLPMFPRPKTADEVIVLEVSSAGGALRSAAFRVHGHGYEIDFAEHSWTRDTALDGGE